MHQNETLRIVNQASPPHAGSGCHARGTGPDALREPSPPPRPSMRGVMDGTISRAMPIVRVRVDRSVELSGSVELTIVEDGGSIKLSPSEARDLAGFLKNAADEVDDEEAGQPTRRVFIDE